MTAVAGTSIQDTARLVPLSPPRERPSRTEPCRVLMTVDAVGGVWRYAMEMGGALRQFGVETVFAGLGPRPGPEKVAEAEATGELAWLDAPLEWMVTDPRDLAALPELLARTAETRRVDLLHLNAPAHAANLDTGLPTAVVSHSCVVTWWRAMRATTLPEQWRWQRECNQAGFDRADVVVSPSRSHAELLRRCYRSLPDVEVVPNAVGLQPLDKWADKEQFVLAAGRWWDEGKGGRTLDAAAASAVWPVKMAGPLSTAGGQELRLEHAESCGELSYGDTVSLMRRAGILASPSLYEPFGLAALEGALSGCALVLADIPTYRELWSDAAFFFEPGNPECLAVAINRLAGEPRLRRQMARAAGTRAAQFAPEKQAQEMAQLYARLREPVAKPTAVGAQ